MLDISSTDVVELEPLRGMPLMSLNVGGTKVNDLSPLKGMPLKFLGCYSTPTKSLSPLAEIPLSSIFFGSTPVKDLSPLKNLPLTLLSCDFIAERDADVVRSIQSLQTINGKSAKEFWKPYDEFDVWVKKVQGMKDPKEQIEAVLVELNRRNPDFKGRLEKVLDRPWSNVTELPVIQKHPDPAGYVVAIVQNNKAAGLML